MSHYLANKGFISFFISGKERDWLTGYRCHIEIISDIENIKSSIFDDMDKYYNSNEIEVFIDIEEGQERNESIITIGVKAKDV